MFTLPRCQTYLPYSFMQVQCFTTPPNPIPHAALSHSPMQTSTVCPPLTITLASGRTSNSQRETLTRASRSSIHSHILFPPFDSCQQATTGFTMCPHNRIRSTSSRPLLIPQHARATVCPADEHSLPLPHARAELWLRRCVPLAHAESSSLRLISPAQRHAAAPEASAAEAGAQHSRCGQEDGAEVNERGGAWELVGGGEGREESKDVEEERE